MSWSGNASHPEKLDEEESVEPGQGNAEPRAIANLFIPPRLRDGLTLDVTGREMLDALHPATLVRRKSVPGAHPHHKPLAQSRLKVPQGIARVSEDAERLLEDYLETGRTIQAKRLTMSLARALEADLGHWEWSVPERTDCLPSLPGHLDHLQALCQPLLTCLITGGAWAEGEFSLCCTAPLEYLANPVLPDPFNSRKGLLPWLRHYPMLFLTFGIGIAAVAGRRYHTLSRLFQEVTMPDPFGIEQKPIALGLFAWSGRDQEIVQQLPGLPEQGGVIDHLYCVLEEPMRELTGRPALYDQAFDRFSLLLTCAYADETLKSGRPLTWVPHDRFRGTALATSMAARLETEARAEGEAWPMLRFGLFQGSSERFLRLLHQVEVLRGNRLDDDHEN